MKFQHLKYMIEVEREKSITRAAKNLYMAQPNLSKAIQELELEIGIQLFTRTSKGVEVTREGAEFLRYARAILSQFKDLEAMYKKTNRDSVHLHISVPTAGYINTAFQEFLSEFCSKPSIDISMCASETFRTIDEIVSETANIGVIRYPAACENDTIELLKHRGLKYEPLCSLPMILLLHRDHPLTRLSEIPSPLLDGYMEILHIESQFPAANRQVEEPAGKIYIDNQDGQFAALEILKGSYMWTYPLSGTLLAGHPLVERPSTPVRKYKDVILYREKSGLSPYEHQFIKYLHQSAENESKEACTN